MTRVPRLWSNLGRPDGVVVVVAGDRDALEADFCDFVESQRGRLLRFAWVLTLDEGLAEDLLQDALMRCWPRWGRVEVGSRNAYVRKALVNGAMNRRRGRRVREVGYGAMSADPLQADGSDRIALRSGLLEVLRTLPAQQRAVIALRFFEDMTEAQAAAALGCSLGTVKSTTSRALARLRQEPDIHTLVDPQERQS